MNDVDKLYARSRSDEVLALAANVVALEERLDDAGTRRRTTDAVLLQRSTQRLVVDKLAGGLHGTQQRSLGVILRRRSPLLGERRRVRSALALYECGQSALLVAFVIVFGR